jgi:hypothetical protein
VPGLPSLDLLSDEVAAELAAQERRSDALDSKAGVLLGFAGVLVGLTVASLHGAWATIGAGFAAAAAVCAGVAVVPRPYPTLEVRRLRETYLTAEEDFTRRRLLDTRIVMYEETQTLLKIKAWLVTAASGTLGIAVVLTVLAGTLRTR